MPRPGGTRKVNADAWTNEEEIVVVNRAGSEEKMFHETPRCILFAAAVALAFVAATYKVYNMYGRNNKLKANTQ